MTAETVSSRVLSNAPGCRGAVSKQSAGKREGDACLGHVVDDDVGERGGVGLEDVRDKLALLLGAHGSADSVAGLEERAGDPDGGEPGDASDEDGGGRLDGWHRVQLVCAVSERTKKRMAVVVDGDG